MLDQILARIKRNYRVLNRIEISKSRLLSNYSVLKNLKKDFSIAPVLKSNAYGHGIFDIGKVLDGVDAPFLCVDSLYEAYQLYKPILPSFFSKVKVKTRILIMGYTNPGNLRIKKLPFEWAVWDIEFLKTLDAYQKGARVHIFVDTGMNREGVRIEDLEFFLETLKQFKNITVVGLMSHLAQCEGADDNLFLSQIAQFKKAKALISKLGFNPKWFHISASDPLMNKNTQKIIFEVSNLARIGKALYGIAPKQMNNLKPILELKTQIIQIKNLKKGDFVGYGGTFKATQDFKLAVLPIGYNDGVDRRLSNKGVVLINGIECPIIGRVSMNITTIDITNVKDVFIGQEILVYSSNPNDPNSIAKIAKLCDTIAHEILIRESPTTRRVLVE